MAEAEDRAQEISSGSSAFADQLVDDLLPDEIDWRRLVTQYPVASLAAAGVGGYLLGRVRGGPIVAALAGFASETVSRNVNSLLGEDVL
jgi:hypothetical protein